jgi:hypothetical protein
MIWEISNGDGRMVKSFAEKVEAGKQHFKSLFSKPRTCHITEIMKILQLVLKAYR